MANRLLDVVIAGAALVPAAPVCGVAAAGIWLTDGRPVVFRSVRIGRDGRRFTMYKFRTMRQARPGDQRITGASDDRVFPWGRLLRRWKIDELPQLLNVLRGDMSVIGPRPEDPAIVDAWYGPLARETLRVRPGLASPGSIFNLTHGERLLVTSDAEVSYVRELLPRKLALDLVYVRGASWHYDLRLMLRAAAAIAAGALGRRRFDDPPEMAEAALLQERLRADGHQHLVAR